MDEHIIILLLSTVICVIMVIELILSMQLLITIGSYTTSYRLLFFYVHQMFSGEAELLQYIYKASIISSCCTWLDALYNHYNNKSLDHVDIVVTVLHLILI